MNLWQSRQSHQHVDNLNAGTNVMIDGGASEGYLEFHPKPATLWPNYYYLYAIPTNQLVLNPNIEHNPGWDK